MNDDTKQSLARRRAALEQQIRALATIERQAEEAPDAIVVRVGATMAEIERMAVLATLVHENWNREATARTLRLSRRTIQTRIREWATGECVRCGSDAVDPEAKVIGTCAACAAEVERVRLADLQQRTRHLSREGKIAVRRRLAAGERAAALAAEYNVGVKMIRRLDPRRDAAAAPTAEQVAA